MTTGIPPSSPGAGRLLIEVRRIAPDLASALVPGVPVVGRVLREATGGPAAGARVAAMAPDAGIPGMAVAVDGALPVPATLDDGAALLLPALWPVVWWTLADRRLARPGDTVLVHDADTPWGLLMTALSRELGVHPLAATATSDGMRQAMRAGAHDGALYTTDWPVLLREHGGADVVLDPSHGQHLPASLGCARQGARLAALGIVTAGQDIAMPLSALRRRNASLHAIRWDPVRHRTHAARAARELPALVEHVRDALDASLNLLCMQ
ncbi:zinc-binding dehydrogenase [Pigmentiphaga kullae]|uniref:NADPH:quinone reductase-like Zn-dependent oxidoreductase n=1 Tax=Pigmentiphaga kullae TaxID=151784 RepID=A0A4Q7NDG7_9BURK|nr:zinc-binding dehydrogenase [Pigmentiphaga kullae]RZS81019.1 NADPH:quinone reductase-like Zn-dependent oxidoreductase [Pigmentiphaga kullae]